MRWTVAVLTGAVVLMTTRGASAQFGASIVLDPSNLIENTVTALNSVKTAVTTAAMYVRQGEALINDYNIIVNQIKQYETMVTNLQRIPQGLNFVDSVLAYGNKLTGLLNTAQGLSYDGDRVTKEFAALYIEAQTVASGDLSLVREKFLTARMQAAGTAVQVQAIRANMSDIFTRLCALLDGSWKAQGNLDSQQIAAQQQALTLTTLQQIQALQTTADRLAAQKEAETVALAQIKQRVLEEFVTAPPDYTGAAGVLPVYQWTDR
jgi:P-type conjugative transfer protein TrbJ